MGFGSLSTNPPAFLGCLQKLWELKLSKVPTLWCWFVPTTKFLSAQTNALAVNKGRQLVSLFQPHHPWKLMKVQRWEKYPISSPTLFPEKSPKTREGLILTQTLEFVAGVSYWSSWHLVIHESCGHGGGHHVSHLAKVEKHLHHTRWAGQTPLPSPVQLKIVTLQIWTCHAPRDCYVATTKSGQRNPWIFTCKRKVNHVNLCQT